MGHATARPRDSGTLVEEQFVTQERPNQRDLYYYGICLSCGAAALRSVSWRGNALPCDKCEIGFRFLLGRRTLWDGDEGNRIEEFQSVVIATPEQPASSAKTERSAGQHENLSPEELNWLFAFRLPPNA